MSRAPRSRRAAAVAGLLALTVPPLAGAESAIVFDGSAGGPAPTVPFGNGGLDHRIDATRGRIVDQNSVFHSFSEFSLDSDDAATFTALDELAIRYVFARVTGGDRSQIDGALRSEIPSADLYLMNPAGVVFGRDARVDVSGSLHVTTADYLAFAGQQRFVAAPDGSVPTLVTAPPRAFGFLARPRGSITIEASEPLRVPFEKTLSLVGGDVHLARGADVGAVSGTVLLVSLASAGEVELTSDGPKVSAGAVLGRMNLSDDSVVSSSGVPAVLDVVGVLNNGQPGSTEPPAEGYAFAGSSFGYDLYVRLGFVGGAGDVFVRSSDLTIVDSEIRSVTGSDASAGRIDILLTGDLTIEKRASQESSGLAAGSGVVVPLSPDPDGPTTVLGGSGAGGAISVVARNVSLEGGATITSTTLSDGAAGSVSVFARDSVVISGADAEGRPSGIFSNAQGSEDGSAGPIDVESGLLRLEGGGGIFAQTTGNARGGNIHVEVDRLQILGSSQTDASTSAQSLRPGDGGTTSGEGGDIHVLAHHSVLLSCGAACSGRAGGPAGGEERSAFGGISTFAGARVSSEAAAGSIFVETPSLEIENGARISATTRGATPGGSVDINTGSLIVRDGSSIEARAVGSALSRGGEIAITADSVFVEWPLGLPGVGGYPRDPRPGDSFISADAGVGVDGSVTIETPEVNVEAQLKPVTVDFLDAAALLQPTCAARTGGEAAGSFTVARRRGLPASPEEWLLALDAGVGEEAPVAAVVSAGDELPPVSASVAVDGFVVAQRSVGETGELVRGGRYADAHAAGQRAAAMLSGSGDVGAQADAQRGVGQAELGLGRYAESHATLLAALRLAEASGDARRIASAAGALANAELALGRREEARRLLAQAIPLAEQSGSAEATAALLTSQGNLELSLGAPADALATYERAAAVAGGAGRAQAQAQALASAGRAALEAGQSERAARHLAEARARSAELAESRSRAFVLLHVGHSYGELARRAGFERQALLAAHEALLEALRLSQRLDDPRAHAFAAGSLGALYERDGRSAEALYLTREAVHAAERADDSEALGRWQWQEGRLLWARGDAVGALAAYRRAVARVEETRQEARAQYGSAEVRFQKAVAPIYRDFADALLASSGKASDPKAAQALLLEAQDAMEKLKAAELRDYFRDECVAEYEAKKQSVSGLSKTTAVVYPISLEDRVELLVGLPTGEVQRYTRPVGAEALARVAREFGRQLSTSPSERASPHAYRASAQQLYDWLVRPYADELAQRGIDTLVLVPDGVLRTIPFAVLHDGERFAIERFAMGVTPGLWLVGGERLEIERAQILLGGVSEPVETGGQRFEALPGVPAEIEAIRSLYGGETLLDETFRVEALEAQIEKDRPAVVHLATHATFTGDPQTSFLVTHDGPLTMERLGKAVSRTRLGDRPLELLTLSACETAVGDERAALGLSGVAVRAGARSALGSLWAVTDASTATLLTDFYRELGTPASSKAKALQQAQIQLLHDPPYSDPYYWAPFLLINNWL